MKTRRAPALPFLVLPVLASAGCADDAPPRDQLVGTWQDLDDDSGEVIATVTFADDGLFRSDSAFGGDLFGSWGIYEDQMALGFAIDDESMMRRMTYGMDGDVLLAPGMIPDGTVDGLVGLWRSEEETTRSDGSSIVVEILGLSADGRAVRRAIENDVLVETDTGRWREDGDDGWIQLDTTDQAGNQETMRLFALPGEAIGRDPLTRAD